MTNNEVVDAEVVEYEPEPFEPNISSTATGKQINMIRAIARGQGIQGDDLKDLCAGILGKQVNVLTAMTIAEASKVIDHLKKTEK
jgi:hypothetical protein